MSLNSASGKAEGEQNFWPSYADMMSSFALILFFLMLLASLSNITTGNNLKDTEAQLSDTPAQLTITRAEADEANQKLLDTQSQLSDTQSQLDDAEAAYATVQLRLDELNSDLANTQLVLSQQQATIDAQAASMALTQSELENAQSELLSMYGQMESIVGVRRSILEQIKASIDSVSGNSATASIGENGSIILSNGVFFDTGSSVLKADSVQVLNPLVGVFRELLANPANTNYIDSIIISGHTDSDGNDEMNRNLSTQRANAVLDYLLMDPALKSYANYFCAAGYGETRPVANNDTEEGKAQNRRIEISITLKDETVMEAVNQLLAGSASTSDLAVFAN